MIYADVANQYKYKETLNDADLMMLGCYLEDTTSYHNAVKFANDIFGCFCESKAYDQLVKYIKDNYTVKQDGYYYTWTDNREWSNMPFTASHRELYQALK